MTTNGINASHRIASYFVSFVLGMHLPGVVFAHGPHVHGKGELEMTVQGAALRGAFRTPMDSLLGFEHLPKTDAQRSSVEGLRQRLTNPSAVVTPNAEAGCTPRMAEATSSLFTGAAKGAHSDLEYRFSFECTAPAKLRVMELTVLKDFKRLSEVQVQLVTEKGQRAVVVRKKDPRVMITNDR